MSAATSLELLMRHAVLLNTNRRAPLTATVLELADAKCSTCMQLHIGPHIHFSIPYEILHL